MKYIIDIPDDGQCQYRYNEDTKELKFQGPRLDQNTFMGADITISVSGVTPYTEPDRKAIENEVWENTWKMFLTPEDFGATMGDSYSEAKAKYDAWKKEIHVGDEVQSKYGPLKGIVTKIDRTGLAIISVDGASDRYVPESFYRTGRHFSEIKEVMEKLENDK